MVEKKRRREEEKKKKRKRKRREEKRKGRSKVWNTKLEYGYLVCMIIILPKPRVLLGFHLNQKLWKVRWVTP